MVRADLAVELKHWLGYVLTALQGKPFAGVRRSLPDCLAWCPTA